MPGRPIVTAAQMRAAEEAVIAAGTSVEALMERAGAAVAEAAWRFGGGRAVLILCGPGNNGGDGYVAARLLAERGAKVRVAATAEPQTDAARSARAKWAGPVETIAADEPAPVLVDALYGTGMSRPLDDELGRGLTRLVARSQLSIAVDLPSGVASDNGALLGPVMPFDITVALGALKPAHHLAAHLCGRVIVADIGIGAGSDWFELAKPRLAAPRFNDHKYSRGMVMVIGGDMAGAARLAASAAMRAGAGVVRLYGGHGGPDALIRRDIGEVRAGLTDERTGAVLLGPGLTDTDQAARLLDLVLSCGRPPVLDAGALRALGKQPERLRELPRTAILTPHEGEFKALFGEIPGSKIARAATAAARAGAVVVLKGPGTVIAAPDGRAAVAEPASHWLSTAGTGDVLAGVIAAMRAPPMPAFEAACAGVWLHNEAARRAGAAFIADDLAAHLRAAVATCL